MNRWVVVALVSLGTLFAVAGVQNSGAAPGSAPPPRKDLPAQVAEAEQTARVEGEQRFRTNCGRCHQAPHKFPPRMMGTIVRHMRVRAMLTEEDMKLILAYMTE